MTSVQPLAAAREALQVEEGLRELRELGVEFQLWRRPRDKEDAAPTA